MCLAIPGEVLTITGEEPLTRVGRVRFGGVVRSVNLGFVPEAAPGDFVIVHVGVAIATLDEPAAARLMAALEGVIE